MKVFLLLVVIAAVLYCTTAAEGNETPIIYFSNLIGSYSESNQINLYYDNFSVFNNDHFTIQII